MGIKHTDTKASGEKGYAAEWNKDHVIDSDVDFDNNAIVNAFGIAPIGSVLPWLKSFTNTPALPNGWVECNGQVLTDAESVYNGQTIPDLNGDNRFLRGNATSGGTGGESTHALTTAELAAHTHRIQATTTAANQSNPTNVYLAGGTFYHANVDVLMGTASTQTIGSGTAHENKPPYYDVVWIMRVK